MIRRLRRKFILINMGLVSLVLLIVFATLCTTSYHRLEGQSLDAMRMMLERDGGKLPKFDRGHEPPAKPLATTPVFSVLLAEDGTVLSVAGGNVDAADTLVEAAVQLAIGSTQESGVLPTLDLRFLKRETPSGLKIAFADRSGERDSIRNLVITSLLVGLGGLCAFFAVSLFLSRWALRPVESAWQQQRQFVADASHELKTPLTVILANMGILLTHRDSTVGTQLKWVEYTRDEATRMKKLVDDLLFLAKSDAARTLGGFAALSLSDLVWSCLLPFESVAFEQRIELDSAIAPSIELTGEEGPLRQLVVILLDNACKYAGAGGHVKLTLERSADRARLAVHNSGLAINPEHLPHLFERFYRADASRSREQGGYGLGLAIAKSIAERHHGKISAESSEAAGTTFTVLLPLQTKRK